MSPEELVKKFDLEILIPALSSASDESFGLTGLTQIFYSQPDEHGQIEVVEIMVSDDGDEFCMWLALAHGEAAHNETEKVAKLQLVETEAGRWDIRMTNYRDPELALEEVVAGHFLDSAVFKEHRANR